MSFWATKEQQESRERAIIGLLFFKHGNPQGEKWEKLYRGMATRSTEDLDKELKQYWESTR